MEVSEGNNSAWGRDHSCDIFVKDVAAFYSCPKNLLEVKLKSFRLISLAEEISSNLAVWLLVITLLQVYNEKEQAGQKEIQNIQFVEKNITRKFKVGAKACAERDKKPDEKWNKGNGYPWGKTIPN